MESKSTTITSVSFPTLLPPLPLCGRVHHSPVEDQNHWSTACLSCADYLHAWPQSVAWCSISSCILCIQYPQIFSIFNILFYSQYSISSNIPGVQCPMLNGFTPLLWVSVWEVGHNWARLLLTCNLRQFYPAFLCTGELEKYYFSNLFSTGWVFPMSYSSKICKEMKFNVY